MAFVPPCLHYPPIPDLAMMRSPLGKVMGGKRQEENKESLKGKTDIEAPPFFVSYSFFKIICFKHSVHILKEFTSRVVVVVRVLLVVAVVMWLEGLV